MDDVGSRCRFGSRIGGGICFIAIGSRATAAGSNVAVVAVAKDVPYCEGVSGWCMGLEPRDFCSTDGAIG